MSTRIVCLFCLDWTNNTKWASYDSNINCRDKEQSILMAAFRYHKRVGCDKPAFILPFVFKPYWGNDKQLWVFIIPYTLISTQGHIESASALASAIIYGLFQNCRTTPVGFSLESRCWITIIRLFFKALYMQLVSYGTANFVKQLMMFAFFEDCNIICSCNGWFTTLFGATLCIQLYTSWNNLNAGALGCIITRHHCARAIKKNDIF